MREGKNPKPLNPNPKRNNPKPSFWEKSQLLKIQIRLLEIQLRLMVVDACGGGPGAFKATVSGLGFTEFRV